MTKKLFSTVKKNYFKNTANFYRLNNKKNILSGKILMVFILCTFCQLLKAQVVVQASFSTFDYQGCVPVKVQFADNSIGDPISWYWDFGDGHTSKQQNPFNTYRAPGTYNVKLIVKNAVSSDSTVNQIVINGAVADFDYTYTNICSAPATINFSAILPQNQILYRWNFGDSGKAIVPQTSHIYTSPGVYKVKLTTISPEGCTDAITKMIKIGGAVIDFTAPTTLCENDSSIFISTSIPKPITATWLVNNTVVQQGNSDSFLYQFKSAGTYNIELDENFGTCSSSRAKQVEVLVKPKAAFTLSGQTQSCSYPDSINFTNNSTGAVAFKWLFGDGDSSMEVSPTHLYQAGQFSPMLVAYNADGCTDTLIQTNGVFLGGPVINNIYLNSINLIDSGCVPHLVTFTPNIASPEAIASYAWDFGDGGKDVTAQPTYTYNTPGRYNVKLTVTTASGCTTTNIVSGAVAVGNLSVPDFTADNTNVCGENVVQFKGTASGPVTNWYWTFMGDGKAFVQNPKYAYKSIGSKSVKLVVNNGGCLDSIVKHNFLVVNAPISRFQIYYYCDGRTKVKFTDKSLSPQSWLWNFGDSTTSTEQNPPVHDYVKSGRYYVSLTTTNGTCTDTHTDTVYIITQKPVFTFSPADGKVCRKSSVELGVNNPIYIYDYLWNLDDGHTLFSDTSIHYTYTKNGVYYPSLITRYRNGCQDTIYSTDSIVIMGPTAAFATNSPAVCLRDSTTFIDNSYSDGVHNIISHTWNYGDNVVETNINPPFTHLYNSSGSFNVTMAITDDSNCADTAQLSTLVNPLPAINAGLDTFVCLGNSALLQPSGGLTYVWNKDPTLSCTDCATPTVTPSKENTYIVTGTDASTCSNTDSVLVRVIEPFKMAIDSVPPGICATNSVQLNATGADFYTWSPADGLNNPSASNPIASPATTTTYTVTGIDSSKCFSRTDSVKVTVHPLPAVTITNNSLSVEKGSINIISTTGSDNITQWSWSPSLGLSCTNCAQPILTAEKSMNYTATVYTDFGCTDTAQLKVYVLCNESKIYIPSAFTPNGDGRNDRFYVLSNIDNPIRTFMIYNRAGLMIFNKTGNLTNYAEDGWDGTYKGRPVPIGTYIYRIIVMCNDKPVPFTGTVTLIR